MNRLIVAIDAAVSICNHIASRLSTKAPESYSKCFEILCDLKIISKALSKKLAAMARFRNLLVHLYWQVDDGKVYDFIKSEIKDIENYLEEISTHIKEDL